MTIRDDGDIVKGIGFVAIYSANIEESIDECLKLLISSNQIDQDVMKWQTSRKLKELKNWLENAQKKPSRYMNLKMALDAASALLEDRNKLIHGSIYATPLGDIIKSSRQDVPEREIKSEEVYDLANEIFELRGQFEYAHMFDLPKVL